MNTFEADYFIQEYKALKHSQKVNKRAGLKKASMKKAKLLKRVFYFCPQMPLFYILQISF